MPPAPRRRTAERLASAARTLLDRGGADAVTVRRVAAAVGVTPMAVYRHYPSRDALLARLADDGFAELSARLDRLPRKAPATERVLDLLVGYLDFAQRRRHLFELMFLRRRKGARRFPADLRARRSPTANLVVEAVTDAIETGSLAARDPWDLAVILGAQALGLIALHLGGRFGYAAGEFRLFYRRLLGEVLAAFAA
jgi:AcrR family transcriptional regulator